MLLSDLEYNAHTRSTYEQFSSYLSKGTSPPKQTQGRLVALVCQSELHLRTQRRLRCRTHLLIVFRDFGLVLGALFLPAIFFARYAFQPLLGLSEDNTTITT